MAWTDEMVEELKRLWAEGVTTGEIGRRLNISKNSIVGKVHRLGLSGRPSPIKKKNENNENKAAADETPIHKKSAKKEKTVKAPKAEEVPATVPAETKTEKKTAPKPETVKPAAHPVENVSDNEEEDIKLAQTLNLQNSEQNKKEYLSLTDLDNHTCRWPVGDPKDENFHFCGRKVRVGQTYCEEHAAIAYVKPSKK